LGGVAERRLDPAALDELAGLAADVAEHGDEIRVARARVLAADHEDAVDPSLVAERDGDERALGAHLAARPGASGEALAVDRHLADDGRLAPAVRRPA